MVSRAGASPAPTVGYLWDGTSFYFSTTRDRAKYFNLQRDPRISLLVDDSATHNYVASYGRAEILEHNPAELVHQLIAKYLPADRVEQFVSEIAADPKRVLVVLHPEKMLSH
jgi:PPOX class probable F420-dependent enzyme